MTGPTRYLLALQHDRIASLRRHCTLADMVDPHQRRDVAALIDVIVAFGIDRDDLAARVGASRSSFYRLAVPEPAFGTQGLPRSNYARQALVERLRKTLSALCEHRDAAARQTPKRPPKAKMRKPPAQDPS